MDQELKQPFGWTAHYIFIATFLEHVMWCSASMKEDVATVPNVVESISSDLLPGVSQKVDGPAARFIEKRTAAVPQDSTTKEMEVKDPGEAGGKVGGRIKPSAHVCICTPLRPTSNDRNPMRTHNPFLPPSQQTHTYCTHLSACNPMPLHPMPTPAVPHP